MPDKRKPLHQRRPAETATGVAGAVALLIAKVFHVTDPQTILAMTVVVAATPAGVTWAVERYRAWKAGA